MRIFGIYQGDEPFGDFKPCNGTPVALEVSAVWIEDYHLYEDKKALVVLVRSGCYILTIKKKDDGYFTIKEAGLLVRKIATQDIVILDDEGATFIWGYDTTPEEYCVTNAQDEYGNDIPLTVTEN